MNARILNRDFRHPEDGWYQIEPKGEHANTRAGVVQVIDDVACEAIVTAFNRAASAPGYAGLLIDHEHFKHDASKESRAYGWLMELQNRADGIYGRIKWTRTGQAAVDGGDYRFFSSEYMPSDLTVLNTDAKGKRVRPTRLAGLTLTNDPNNKGGRPITNRFPSAEPHGANNTTTKKGTMKTVATKLGLSADASEEAVLSAVTAIMNRASEAEGKIPTLTNRVTELEAEHNTLVGEQIDADLAARGVTSEKIMNRVKPILAGLKNRAERTAWLDDMEYKPSEKPKDGTGNSNATVLNRAGAKTPAAAKPEADEKAKADKIMNRASELVKGGMDYDTAWARAKTETN